MEYNECRTCGAKDGRAGLLIADECQNCHRTRKERRVIILPDFPRSAVEMARTMAILDAARLAY